MRSVTCSIDWPGCSGSRDFSVPVSIKRQLWIYEPTRRNSHPKSIVSRDRTSFAEITLESPLPAAAGRRVNALWIFSDGKRVSRGGG